MKSDAERRQWFTVIWLWDKMKIEHLLKNRDSGQRGGRKERIPQILGVRPLIIVRLWPNGIAPFRQKFDSKGCCWLLSNGNSFANQKEKHIFRGDVVSRTYDVALPLLLMWWFDTSQWHNLYSTMTHYWRNKIISFVRQVLSNSFPQFFFNILFHLVRLSFNYVEGLWGSQDDLRRPARQHLLFHVSLRSFFRWRFISLFSIAMASTLCSLERATSSTSVSTYDFFFLCRIGPLSSTFSFSLVDRYFGMQGVRAEELPPHQEGQSHVLVQPPFLGRFLCRQVLPFFQFLYGSVVSPSVEPATCPAWWSFSVFPDLLLSLGSTISSGSSTASVESAATGWPSSSESTGTRGIAFSVEVIFFSN